MCAEDGEEARDLCVMFALKTVESETNFGRWGRPPNRVIVVIALQHFRNSERRDYCGFPVFLQEVIERKVLFPDCLG